MSKVTASTDIDKVSDDDVSRYTEMVVEDIVRVLNGDVDFQTNIRCKLVRATFGQANMQQAVTHNLGKIPIAAIPIKSSVAVSIFDGASADKGNSASVMYLQSSVAGTFTLLIF